MGRRTALPDRPAHGHDRCRAASGLSAAGNVRRGARSATAPGPGHAAQK